MSVGPADIDNGIHFFVNDGTTNAFRERRSMRLWLHRVARTERRRIGRIAFVLMSDPELLSLNKRFLDHHDLTDVITFDEHTGDLVRGDVLISYDRVRENAMRYGVARRDELHRVMVHGLLHLCGHSDKSDPQKLAMRRSEDLYLQMR
ncbi:MAG: rRNA maturation RNase YbeY [Flavobacteriales bacterium]|nr:rRNA maturation RNase YbeY [Flavobacteriales bacterium]